MSRQISYSAAPKSEQSRNDSDAIRNLQTYLRELSYVEKRIPPVPIDGIYGSATRTAIEAFQAIHRIPVTGTVDQRTWELLYAEYLRVLAEHHRPMGIFPFPHEHSITEGISSPIAFLGGGFVQATSPSKRTTFITLHTCAFVFTLT